MCAFIYDHFRHGMMPRFHSTEPLGIILRDYGNAAEVPGAVHSTVPGHSVSQWEETCCKLYMCTHICSCL